MRRILITGIPATGKTTLGNHLATHRGIEHLDFEDLPTLQRCLGRGVLNFHDQMAKTAGDVVVTWGFDPDSHLEVVMAMRTVGFEWIWLDGDRAVARNKFIARGTVPVQALDIQMEKINRCVDLAGLQPRVIDPFEADGSFRPIDALAAQVLQTPSRSGYLTDFVT